MFLKGDAWPPVFALLPFTTSTYQLARPHVQRAPAVVFPEQPPKFWLGSELKPHPVQLQLLPSGSWTTLRELPVQTRIGWSHVVVYVLPFPAQQDCVLQAAP